MREVGGVSVTNELREQLLYHTPAADAALQRLLDRIDETVASEYVRLPKDADGVSIHIGDVMEGVDKYDSLKKVMGKVITISFESDEAVDVAIQAWSDDGKSWHRAYLDPYASVYRHHHEPTVEDVLLEFAKEVQTCWDTVDTITEYADRIREVLRDE